MMRRVLWWGDMKEDENEDEYDQKWGCRMKMLMTMIMIMMMNDDEKDVALMRHNPSTWPLQGGPNPPPPQEIPDISGLAPPPPSSPDISGTEGNSQPQDF